MEGRHPGRAIGFSTSARSGLCQPGTPVPRRVCHHEHGGTSSICGKNCGSAAGTKRPLSYNTGMHACTLIEQESKSMMTATRLTYPPKQ